MQFGMIGLGRMGANMVRRLIGGLEHQDILAMHRVRSRLAATSLIGTKGMFGRLTASQIASPSMRFEFGGHIEKPAD